MKEGLPGGGLSFFLGDSHDDSWADAPPFSPRGENPPEGLLAAARLTLAGRARSKRHARRGISVLAHRCGDTIPGPYRGRQSCRCLENQLALSAAGGASLIFPLLDLPFKRHKEGATAPSLETPPTKRQRGQKWSASISTLKYAEARQVAA